MKRDIDMSEPQGVAIAIVPEQNEGGAVEWSAYFLNLKDTPVEVVLINAEGKGKVNGIEKKTSLIRFFLDTVPAKSGKKFEMILPEAFVLDNQYWVSFYSEQHMFDKKFLFAANSIRSDKLTLVPLLNMPGIVLD